MKNTTDNYSFWPSRLKKKSDLLKKSFPVKVSQRESLDLIAKMLDYKNWDKFLYYESRWHEFYTDIYLGSYSISYAILKKNLSYHKAALKNFLKIFPIVPPSKTNFYTWHIEDFLNSSCPKAILPFLGKKYLYFKKCENFEVWGKIPYKGNYIYIEENNLFLRKTDIPYFKKLLMAMLKSKPDFAIIVSLLKHENTLNLEELIECERIFGYSSKIDIIINKKVLRRL